MILSMNAALEVRSDRGLVLGLVATLTSFVVLADSGDLLRLTPAYNTEQLGEEIYDSMDEWRMPPAYDSEWRSEKPRQESRIKFGYDSAYEEMRARGYDNSLYTGSNHGEPVPSSQIRISF